jgi:hypothetical protein
LANYSIAFCQTQLDKYVAAEEKVLSGQSYSIGGRSMTRANLADIRNGIDYWNEKLTTAKSAGSTGRRMIMRRTIIHG